MVNTKPNLQSQRNAIKLNKAATKLSRTKPKLNWAGPNLNNSALKFNRSANNSGRVKMGRDKRLDNQVKHKEAYLTRFVLFLGVLNFSMVLILLPFLLMLGLGFHFLVAYIIFILTGLAFGFFIFVLSNENRMQLNVFVRLSVFSPILALITIIGGIRFLDVLLQEAQRFISDASIFQLGPLAGSLFSMVDSGLPGGIITGSLFYVAVLVFPTVRIMQQRKYNLFMWYLIPPTILLVIWIVVNTVFKHI